MSGRKPGKALGLFEGPAPRLRAAPASAPFLSLLADAMVEALHRPGDPFGLSDALVFLPTRRAARGLVDAFAERLGGAALLPAIRPLGDVDEDPEVWGAEPLALDAPPAIEKTRRRLELAALIRARDAASGGVEDPARAIAFADELAKLLDAAATVDSVAWEKLPHLADAADLAQHWQSSAQFLDIIAAYWPQRLAADGLSDPGARRATLLHALADEWERTPPTRPIIIAGSTGSVAATRALMRAVSNLPRGVVVFPGLDIDLDDAAWDAVRDQHPQFALKETLAALGVDRRDVRSIGDDSEPARARRVLLREALAPAEYTADWLARLETAGGAAFVAKGAEGLKLLEAATEDEEAGAIALLLREALEQGRSGALVTPDNALARRVEAKLARWDIAPIVSHGRALRETPAGALLALLCDLAADPSEPIALAALLKHPLTRAPGGVTALEHEALRGARRHETLAELKALAKTPAAQHVVDWLGECLAPISTAVESETLTLADFSEALIVSAEQLTGFEIWSGADGEDARTLLAETHEHGGELGAMPAWQAPRAFLKLMENREAVLGFGGDARLAIWHPLEARLQRRDLMVLGGLNEGVWPAPPGQDPFLSRAMRHELGLPSLDARIGLAAHDFAQLASAPDVVLTRSLKRDGAPSIASRWLWRLETLAKGASVELTRPLHALDWARALDAPPAPRTTRAPRPTPPPDARIRRISVTQVETLIRDPYAVYARHILGLYVLNPIGMAPGARERGTAIHGALERFADGDDPAGLLRVLDEELHKAGFTRERRVAEQARLLASVSAFLDWLDARRDPTRVVYAERKGELPLSAGAVLVAKADRVEISASGAAILDYKTGAPPSDAVVASGLAPQLPLETAMLSRGVFADVPAARANELIYWRFGGADPAPSVVELKGKSVQAAGEEALAALEDLLQAYARAEQPFLSKPRVQFLKPYADYDHLARRKEWADAEGEE